MRNDRINSACSNVFLRSLTASLFCCETVKQVSLKVATEIIEQKAKLWLNDSTSVIELIRYLICIILT